MLPNTKSVRLLSAVLFTFAMTPITATAQNLTANGDFDTDLSSWQQSDSPSAVWAALDFIGSATSGSALLENDAADANTRLYPLTQCITPPGPGYYVLSVQGFIAPGQTSGRLVLSYAEHNGADCTGGGASGGQFLEQIGLWQNQTMLVHIPDVPIASVEIMLGIEKDDAGGSLQGNFDAIVLDDHLFADGFENAP